MKDRYLVKVTAVAAAFGFMMLSGCSERQEVADAPKAQEVERRAENAAASSDYDSTVAQQTYEKHCASCHPNGGNIINSEKNLKKASLEAKGIATAEDIVKIMRDPGPGMPAFNEQTIPEDLALDVGRYILDTFK
ncbi:c-type cytochrome [Geoalkalibacter subterraneus]|uniref:c-type cytochrome n=1 Tax=Geoalkalibacter subterraneus TaxID=483547 RepID=UPI0006938E1C|nr:c-type cytochrome [Geoalkalibacter subterraneus]